MDQAKLAMLSSFIGLNAKPELKEELAEAVQMPCKVSRMLASDVYRERTQLSVLTIAAATIATNCFATLFWRINFSSVKTTER